MEVAAVVEQSLEGRETHQRHAGHLVMDTGMLKIKEKEGKSTWNSRNDEASCGEK